MFSSENITKIVGLLIQRAAELTENTKNLKNEKNLVDIYNEFNKNLSKYLHSLSTLQTYLPLIFKDVLINYMKLIEFVLENGEYFNDYVLRAAAICLSTSLRRYSIYNEDNSSHKKLQLEEFKKQCVIEFRQFFSSEKIEAFFNTFLLKMLPRRPFLSNQQDPDNLDDFVEIGMH